MANERKKIEGPVIRSAYSPHDPELYASWNNEPSMCKQAQADACDINNIVAKFQRDGILTHIQTHEGDYRDLDGATFTEMMHQVAEARSLFEELPSKARSYFDNDPAKYLDYMNNLDDDGVELLEELGLAIANPFEETSRFEEAPGRNDAPTENEPSEGSAEQ